KFQRTWRRRCFLGQIPLDEIQLAVKQNGFLAGQSFQMLKDVSFERDFQRLFDGFEIMHRNGQGTIKVKYPVFSGYDIPDSLMPGLQSEFFRLKPLDLCFHLIVVLVFKHFFTLVLFTDSRASRLPATAVEASCCLHTGLSPRLPSGRNMTSPACRLR